MYMHYRCGKPHNRLYAIQMDDPPGGRVGLKAPRAQYDCPGCGNELRQSGRGAKRPAPGAIVMTAARLEGRARTQRASVKRGQKFAENRRLAMARQRQQDDSSGEDSSDEEEDDDQDDVDYAPKPEHSYNIRMRTTSKTYSYRASFTYDSSCVLQYHGDIRATAGRLALNSVMGRYLGIPSPSNLPAWQHAGTVRYSVNKAQSSEWCHLVADSLGGPSVPQNLVAASYSANTYMAALEVLLKGQTDLAVEVKVRCSQPHVAEYIYYRILHRKRAKLYQVEIDGRADGFSDADLDRVQVALQSWLSGVGIKVNRSA